MEPSRALLGLVAGLLGTRCKSGQACVTGFVALVLALSGCRGKQLLVIQEVPLGTFHVDAAGSSAGGEFRIPGDATNSNLGFEILGLARSDANAYITQWQHVLNELSSGRMRVRLQLFLEISTNDFYCATFPLGLAGGGAEYGADGMGANYMDSGDTKRARPLCLFTGIKPLGFYSDFDLLGDVTVTYHFQTNMLPVKHWKLIPDLQYKVKLTVLEPIALTNQFQLVLHSACPSSK
jgi:hypothetical protein